MKLTKEQILSLWIQLSLSLVTIVIGIMFLNRERMLWLVIFVMLLVTLLVTGVFSVFQAIRHRDYIEGLIGIGAFLMAVVIISFKDFYIELTALAFGSWALFNMFVQGLKIFISIKDKTRIKFTTTLSFLMNLVMGVLLIFSGVESRYLINLQIGIYIILFGVVQGFSAGRVLFRDEVRVSFSMPVFFAALIPNILIQNINKIEDTTPDLIRDEVITTEGDMLSVYLYAKDEGFNRIGHLDIGYRGSIYSYGAHDNYNRAKSMAYGDGVMIIGSERDFVSYAVETGTAVFRFKVRLSPEQSSRIESKIEEILEDAYYYNYPYKKDPDGINYLTRLRQAGLHLDFYKFHRGKFKTYNVFTTNCVILADRIIGATGMRLFQMSGVATPGAYYEFLNTQLEKPGSIVYGKEIFVGKKV